MDTRITKEAKKFIESYNILENDFIYEMIGAVMTFSKRHDYKQRQALLAFQERPIAINYLKDNRLGICHYIKEDKIILFIPPKKKSDQNQDFFDRQLKDSLEFLFV